MAENSLEVILARNEFYQKNYHRMLSIIGMGLLIIGLLVGFIKLKTGSEIQPRYFPTTPDGKIIQSPPFTENHLLLTNYQFNANDELIEWPEVQKKYLDLTAADSNEHAILLFWTKKAVVAMFDYDYINYQHTIQNLRDYFTAQGYKKFLEAFRASNNLEAVKTGKRVAFADITGTAKVVSTGMLQERKVWQIEMPLRVTYESVGEEPLIQNLYAVVKVARVSTLQARFYGLAIYQISFKAV